MLLKASNINLPKAFVCQGNTQPTGRYTLEALHEPQPTEKTLLKVYQGDKVLCELPGSPTKVNSTNKNSRTHVLTRVNPQMKAIEVSVVLPPGMRAQIPNQVFYIPLASGN